MTGIRLIVDKRRALNNGSYPLKVAVKHHGSFLVSFGMTVDLKEFDEHTNRFTATDQMTELRNIQIESRLNLIKKFIIEQDIAGNLPAFSDRALKMKIEHCLDPNAHARTFIEMMDEYISKIKKPSTKRLFLQTRDKVLEFDAHPTFQSITYTWLTRFEQEMSKNNLKINSQNIHFRNIRTIFNYAIKNEETQLYPFKLYQIKKEKVTVKVLTVDELRAIATVPIEPHLQRYRDTFMLSFYLIGINLADLVSPDSRIVNGRFEFLRQKTGRFYSIRIEPEAAEILARYGNDPRNLLKGTSLTGLETSANRELKHFSYSTTIYGQGGKKVRDVINPEITLYHARRTWATIAYNNCRISKDDVSLALGHQNGSAVTDHYIAYRFDAIDRANRAVIDYFLSTMDTASLGQACIS